MRVRLLRLWYGIREHLGLPRRVPEAEFNNLSHTVLLAGSPWVIWSSSTANPTARFWVTNSTWPVRQD